jgi:hypothetical protein
MQRYLKKSKRPDESRMLSTKISSSTDSFFERSFKTLLIKIRNLEENAVATSNTSLSNEEATDITIMKMVAATHKHMQQKKLIISTSLLMLQV